MVIGFCSYKPVLQPWNCEGFFVVVLFLILEPQSTMCLEGWEQSAEQVGGEGKTMRSYT